MAVQLKHPLAWTTATGDAAAMLDELQPNILKGHVRDHLSVLLLRFADQSDARTFLSQLVDAKLMKSAKKALKEAAAYRRSRRPGTPYVGVGLTAAGYAALGIEPAKRPSDPSFRRGMRAAATQRTLGDPPASAWEQPYQGAIHAIVLVGDKTAASVRARRREVMARLPGSVTVVGEERGRALLDEHKRGVEHFGYIDGRSQPLFLTEDVDDERATTDGTTVWDPAFPLAQVLVADPAASHPSTNFGSYFVFRKLEQNVQLFKRQEELMARQLGLTGEDRERAGAMLVGRFEDGTPVTLQGEDGADRPVMNDFTYASDPHGLKCPRYAHIRKVNPRSSTPSGRSHLMARRGQTYGERTDSPDDETVPISKRPTGDVGLLFMAFNASVTKQFEYTQRRLANDGDATIAADPVIGQGLRGRLTSPTSWGGTEVRTTDPIAQAVTMKGGEYFFMPSLAFLRSL
jgi:Dyp-type peroxidase family